MKARGFTHSLWKSLVSAAGYIIALVCCLVLMVSPSKGVQADTQPSSNQQTASYTLPFRSVRKNDILIPVVINQKQFWFLLDTGTVLDITLDVWAARLLHLSQKPAASSLLGGDYHASVGSLKSIKMPFEDTPRQNVEVTIAHLSDQSPEENGKVAGIIGVPMLEGRALTIDYLHKTLTITNAPPPPVAEAPTIVLTMLWHPGGYYVSVKATNGQLADLYVDTGSDLTLLPQAIVQGVPFQGVQSCVYMDPDGKELITWNVLLSQLFLGSLCEPDVPAGIAAPDQDPRLGSDILSRFVVTIDFQNQKMLLRRSADYAKRTTPKAWVHAFVFERRGKYYVDYVQPEFASTVAGLREGDRILKVDGRPITPAYLDAEGSLAPGLEGSKVLLQVQHGHASPRQVICSRHTGYLPLTSSQHGLFGYILRKRFHKPITVESYWGPAKGAPQIPVGSKILKIENVSMIPLSLSDIQPFLLRSKMPIDIIKPSGKAARIIVK